jgi:hypothetical protein
MRCRDLLTSRIKGSTTKTFPFSNVFSLALNMLLQVTLVDGSDRERLEEKGAGAMGLAFLERLPVTARD